MKNFKIFPMMATFFGFTLFCSLWVSRVHAECYGVYSDNGWETKCGDVPAPGAKYEIPTADQTLNQVDKLYLCSLVHVSETECPNIQFSMGPSTIINKNGSVQFGIDVRMISHNKQCAATVWKTYRSDNTWVLSSPTSILGFPYECQFQ